MGKYGEVPSGTVKDVSLNRDLEKLVIECHFEQTVLGKRLCETRLL